MTDTTAPPAPTPSATRPIRVDVWSDIACPWCYIGKRKFESGVAAYRAANPEAPEVEVTYRSFELAPDTPEDFTGSEVDFLVAYKGMPADRVEEMLAQVTSIAASVGLAYDFDALRHARTVPAHRVLHHAKAKGVQLEAVERLLSAYFIEGRFLGSAEELADLATDVGLDRVEVLDVLAGDRYLDAVRADQAVAQEYGITGVPFYVFDEKYGVSGAQDPSAFAQVLTTVAAERSDASAS